MNPKRFRGPQLCRAVQGHVKDYIVEHRLKPGDALPPETRLAQELGISRGSVREAIKAMETLGIVEVRHGNGLFVRGFNLDAMLELLSHLFMHDPDRVPEFLQIRQWLELAAMEVVVDGISESTIRELEAVLARWEACLHRGDAWRQEHRTFHQVLSRVAKNDSLVALIDIFWLLYNQSRFMENIPDVEPAVHLEYHRKILEAVRARDVVAARQRLLDSFSPVYQQMRSWGRAAAPAEGAVR